MKKNVLAPVFAILLSAVVFQAHADDTKGATGQIGSGSLSMLSYSQRGEALGQIIDKGYLSNSNTKLLQAALGGQSYEHRVSILETKCVDFAKGTQSQCVITIGVDDTQDSDSGWGTVYKLKFKLLKFGNKVFDVSMEAIAG